MLNETVTQWIETQGGRVSLSPFPSDPSEINLQEFLSTAPPALPGLFFRCIKKIEAVPGLKARLGEMKSVSEPWRLFVEHWDEFETLLNKDENNHKDELFNRMKEVLLGSEVMAFLDTGRLGATERTIISALTKFNVKGTWPVTSPLRPEEFADCVHLLQVIPEFKGRLAEMKTVSKTWSNLVDQWDVLESLLEKEKNTKSFPLLSRKLSQLQNRPRWN